MLITSQPPKEAFSKALLPSLLLLDQRNDPKEAPVWTQSKETFEKKVAELPTW